MYFAVKILIKEIKYETRPFAVSVSFNRNKQTNTFGKTTGYLAETEAPCCDNAHLVIFIPRVLVFQCFVKIMYSVYLSDSQIITKVLKKPFAIKCIHNKIH